MNDETPPKTASELIDRFGGTKQTAEKFGVLPSAVSNWRNNGIPKSMQYRVFREAAAAGITLEDKFFDEGKAA